MHNKEPILDKCRCSICGWKGWTKNCKIITESEGWEYPEYKVHLCPKCSDGGCIDDYWPSSRAMREFKSNKYSKKYPRTTLLSGLLRKS